MPLSFQYQLCIRFVLILLGMLLLSYLLLLENYWVVKGVVGFGVGLMVWRLWYFINKTNRDLEVFINAYQSLDSNTRLSTVGSGMSFQGLHASLNNAVFQQSQRYERFESELAILKCQIETVPVPLVRIDNKNTIQLLNKSARKLFNHTQEISTKDLEIYGEEFQEKIIKIQPTEKILSNFSVGELVQKVLINCTEVSLEYGHYRLISIQNLQQELDANEAFAWKQIFDVLTHEIMNSITPISSLISSAKNIAGEIKQNKQYDDELNIELYDALSRVARRSEGLIGFVQEYKKISQLPEPKKHTISVNSFLQDVVELFRKKSEKEKDCKHVFPSLEKSQKNTVIHADQIQLEQVLINLLCNALDAVKGVVDPSISIVVHPYSEAGCTIDVIDNGSGIDEEIKDKIFLPFFTTKTSGSGVGLALAQQIMLLHGGSIRCISQPGETRIRLHFPI